ncbi:MAG: cytochrome bc complex cytochrome b subunit [Zoogloeaceae bacterium]|jgi:ubiquinol-cytochrome c reductase cytochrome b subunit|nr:cytochrome bc complex cytochrome b subunit [Zoogloeaceae bacterium]
MATNSNFEKYKSNGTLLGNLLEWVDARFPATSMWKAHLSEYYAPKNFNFWYYFGSLALLVLVIQIVTGIFLAMNYKPDATLNAAGLPVAFASVSYIMNDVDWGWLIRYMHSTGASAFFIVVYLHMFRGLLYGSYRKPRELIWVFGILIFLCLMAEAFMGYLLPWGQMSYWGAQVIVNLFSAIPLVGEPLSLWIRGDFVIGDATLNRFFAFHIVAVPLALIGLVVAHLLALHEVGSNNPDGIEIKKITNEKGIPLDGIPFHPYYTVKDIAGVAVFLALFSIVVFFLPEGGGYFLEYNNFFPADPMKTPEHIAPVWYFTPFYSMLRAMVWNFFGLDAKFWGVVAMGGGVVILAFLPWIDRSPAKSIRYRGPIYKTLLTIFVFGFLILGFLGMQAPGYYFFGYKTAMAADGKTILFDLRNYLFSGGLIAQVFTVYYFLFFLTMPWWSKIDKCKPVPERVTWK